MNGTVLLIDYDPRSIGRIRTLLNGAGLRTFIARDGLSGIEIFERLRPDITLIQDLVPRKPGNEVCRAIKDTAHGTQSVVVMIAPGHNGHRRRALDAGCDDCLVKPFEDASLIETIQRLLPRVEAQVAEAVALAKSAEAPPATQGAAQPGPVLPPLDELELDACLNAALGMGGPAPGIAGDVEEAPVAPVAPAPRKRPGKRAKKSATRSSRKKRAAASEAAAPARRTRKKRAKRPSKRQAAGAA